jgi:hypothetical protein
MLFCQPCSENPTCSELDELHRQIASLKGSFAPLRPSPCVHTLHAVDARSRNSQLEALRQEIATTQGLFSLCGKPGLSACLC